MSIDNTLFYEQKVIQFSAGTSSQRFRKMYIVAVNRALNMVNQETDSSVAVTEIEDTETEIDIDSELEYAFSDIVDFWLLKMGNKSADLTLQEAKNYMDVAMETFRLKRDRDNDESADDEDETIGLLYD